MALQRPLVLLGASLLLLGSGCRSDVQFNPNIQPPPLGHDHGQWLSMDIGPSGDLAVTYYDREYGGIGFARGEIQPDDTVWWHHEKVDGYAGSDGVNPGDRGRFTSMQIDAEGVVWASYQDSVNHSLRVAHRRGDTWESELADAGSGITPEAGLWTSLALGPDGQPIVAHYDKANSSLRVARRDAEGTWSAEQVWEGEPFETTDAEGQPVTRPADVGTFARLYLDGDTEYLAFHDSARQSLELLEGTAGSYSHTTVHSEGRVGQWPSLWKEGETLYVAFHDMGNQDLLLAQREGTGDFSVEVVDDARYVGADTEVFVHEGRVHIVYFDGYDNDMKLAVQGEEGWELQRVGASGVGVGYHNEVAFDGTRWWAASYNYTSRDIFVRPL